MHDVLINTKVLAKNNEIADNTRERLRAKGIFSLNLMSAPGSGKTSIVEKTVEALKERLRIAVIVGDIQTDLDTRRIASQGVPATQINTGRSCHLDAHMVEHALPWLFEQGETEMLIIENVGNMVCPAEFDLGEEIKVAVMSVTEGEDKPLKYPALFSAASFLILNKTDLLPHIDFDPQEATRNALKVNPALKVIRMSCVDGTGVEEWAELLLARQNTEWGVS